MKNLIEEKPLGPREVARLRGELLCYRDAKTLVHELAGDYQHRKRAITALHQKTGGRNWLSPVAVAEIVEQTRETPATSPITTSLVLPFALTLLLLAGIIPLQAQSPITLGAEFCSAALQYLNALSNKADAGDVHSKLILVQLSESTMPPALILTNKPEDITQHEWDEQLNRNVMKRSRAQVEQATYSQLAGLQSPSTACVMGLKTLIRAQQGLIELPASCQKSGE